MQVSQERAPEALAQDRFVQEADAAELLALSQSYLRKLRVVGGGPRFYRLGGKSIRYRVCDLFAWAEGQAATSTSEIAGA